MGNCHPPEDYKEISIKIKDKTKGKNKTLITNIQKIDEKEIVLNKKKVDAFLLKKEDEKNFKLNENKKGENNCIYFDNMEDENYKYEGSNEDGMSDEENEEDENVDKKVEKVDIDIQKSFISIDLMKKEEEEDIRFYLDIIWIDQKIFNSENQSYLEKMKADYPKINIEPFDNLDEGFQAILDSEFVSKVCYCKWKFI